MVVKPARADHAPSVRAVQPEVPGPGPAHRKAARTTRSVELFPGPLPFGGDKRARSHPAHPSRRPSGRRCSAWPKISRATYGCSGTACHRCAGVEFDFANRTVAAVEHPRRAATFRLLCVVGRQNDRIRLQRAVDASGKRALRPANVVQPRRLVACALAGPQQAARSNTATVHALNWSE